MYHKSDFVELKKPHSNQRDDDAIAHVEIDSAGVYSDETVIQR